MILYFNLQNFNQSGMGVTAKLVKETLSVSTSLPESECADKVLKARSASEQIKPLVRSLLFN